MAQEFERVRPGDLITADLMNRILEKLKALGTRVASLESITPGTTAVVITDLSPTGTLRVGDILQVNGRNFVIPAVNNTVTVGGVRVQTFRFGSSDTKLIFDIPDVPGLDSEGSPLTVVVSNSNGQDSYPLTLKPTLIIPQGRIEVIYAIPPVMPEEEPNITAGMYTFIFSVTAFVDLDATYTLTPSITGVGAWTAELLQDTVDQPRPNSVVAIPGNVHGEQRNVRVRVTVPTGQSAGVTGTLILSVNENTAGSGVAPGNDQIQIIIGSPPPTPETRVRITLVDADGGAEIVGSKVQFTRNSEGRVRFNLLFAVGGEDFLVAAEMSNPTGWSPADINPSSLDVTAPTSGNTTDAGVNVIFTAGATATDSDLLLTVTRGQDISVQYVLGVAVV